MGAFQPGLDEGRLANPAAGNRPVRLLLQRTEAPVEPKTDNTAQQVIGRRVELDRLGQALAASLAGDRRVVFVSGEPGIGKTTLVDALAAEAQAAGVTVAHGQCFEHFGPGEPYLPVLDALATRCHGENGARTVEVLQRNAPSWLAQLPGLLDEAQRERLERMTSGATPARMLREIVAALDILAAPDGLLLILEDLHWADLSTVELLAYLASQRRGARLLIVGTFRPADLILHDHALKRVKQALLARRHTEEITLELFDLPKVRALVAHAAPGLEKNSELIELICHRTEGNPLFVGEVVVGLRDQNLIAFEKSGWHFTGSIDTARTMIPLGLRELIDQHVSVLPPTQRRILEAASVAGAEITGTAVAAAANEDAATVETILEDLAREGRFLTACGLHSWPDASVSGSYRFLHALYQESLYEGVGPARRAECHRRVGEREAAAWGARAPEHAAQLALHFERGLDLERAASFHGMAGETALRRHAYVEARNDFARGLALLERSNRSDACAEIELGLRMGIAVPIRVLEGYATGGALETHERAVALADRIGDTRRGFLARYGLCEGSLMAGKLDKGRDLAADLLVEAEKLQEPSLEMQARYVLGEACVFTGEIEQGRDHLERSAELYDPDAHRDLALISGQDPGMASRADLGPALWMLGLPDAAAERSREAIEIARALSRPFDLCYALVFSAVVHHMRGEPDEVRERASEVVKIAGAEKIPHWLALGQLFESWLEIGGGNPTQAAARASEAISALIETGNEVCGTYFVGILIQAFEASGEHTQAMAVLDEAFVAVANTSERFAEAELYRLRGRAHLARAEPDSQALAETDFIRALTLAREQHALSWELRAADSLARLQDARGEREAALEVLQAAHRQFTEGFHTADLRSAESLIRALGGEVSRSAAATGPAPTAVPSRSEVGRSGNTGHLFRREGEYWTISFEGVTCRLRDVRGLHFLAQLLDRPGQEVHALEIAGGSTEALSTAGDHVIADAARGGTIPGPSDAGEVLDPEARASYRRRLDELRTDLAEAREFNDLGRIEHAETEIEFLTRELSQAVGLGGRTRRAASTAERARVNVTRGIRTAIAKLRENHPRLGEHLSESVRTGTFCCYAPAEPGHTRWSL